MPTLSAKEAAIELDTDARTFRKFMRSITPKEEQPGQGNRYSIESKDIKKLKKQFEEFNTRAKPSSNGKAPKEEVVDVDDDELLDEVDLDEDLSIDDADEEVDEDDDGEPVDLDELDPDEDELLALDEDPDLEEDIEELT